MNSVRPIKVYPDYYIVKNQIPQSIIYWCCSLIRFVPNVTIVRYPYSIPYNTSHLPVHCILYTSVCGLTICLTEHCVRAYRTTIPKRKHTKRSRSSVLFQARSSLLFSYYPPVEEINLASKS